MILDGQTDRHMMLTTPISPSNVQHTALVGISKGFLCNKKYLSRSIFQKAFSSRRQVPIKY